MRHSSATDMEIVTSPRARRSYYPLFLLSPSVFFNPGKIKGCIGEIINLCHMNSLTTYTIPLGALYVSRFCSGFEWMCTSLLGEVGAASMECLFPETSELWCTMYVLLLFACFGENAARPCIGKKKCSIYFTMMAVVDGGSLLQWFPKLGSGPQVGSPKCFVGSPDD